jgi:hypothetical protein
VTLTVRFLCALVCAGALASAARAQFHPPPPHPPIPPGYVPYPPQPIPWAPDACGPGYYTWCPDGSYLGPNYCLYPPFPPWNGMVPAMRKQPSPVAFANAWAAAPAAQRPELQKALVPIAPQTTPPPKPNGPPPMMAFPTHPYARSPRDFFMWGEAQQELHTRQGRPGSGVFMWSVTQQEVYTRGAQPPIVPREAPAP